MQIPFLDLQSQYRQLKTQIDGRIQKVIDHGQFVSGPETVELEKALCDYTGAKYCVSVASGTDALMMALMALNVRPGDEVITPDFSFIAAAEMIALLGATPVLVDVEPGTYNLDVTQLKQAITSKTRAIIPVSLYGQPADMDEIKAIAGDIPVIEDAAQSFGADYKNKKSCNLSEYSCTSFFPAKPLGCYGDGGAIFTNNDDMITALREIRVHGQSSRYNHTRIGLTGRMDTLQCGILLAKLTRFPWEVEQRIRLGRRYDEALADCQLVSRPEVKNDRSCVYAQYTLRSSKRQAIIDGLNKLGVPTSVHYPIPIHQQLAYREISRRVGDLKESIHAANEVFSLPLFPDMTEAQQDHVIQSLLTVAR